MMINKAMCGKKFSFYLNSGKIIKGVLKETWDSFIVVEKTSQTILNGKITSEEKSVYNIAMDKIEYVLISNEKTI